MSILGRWTCACGCDDILDLVMKCPKCGTERPMEERRTPSSFFVGLAGPAHVGKSTTTDALLELSRSYSGPAWEVRSFAAPIYEMVSAMTGRSVEELKLTKEVVWTAETAPMPSLIGWWPRKLLQLIGEGMRQSISPQVWVESATVVDHYTKPIVVFDDARHDPEYAVCDVVIELERAGLKYTCDHPSAMPPDPEKVDFVLKMDGHSPRDVARAIANFVIETRKIRAVA